MSQIVKVKAISPILLLNFPLPVMLYSESVSVCSVIQSLYSQPEDRTLPTSVRVGQLQRFITEPPTHRRLSAYVGVHYAPQSVKNKLKMCDSWLPW